jgi:hypothetical protein
MIPIKKIEDTILKTLLLDDEVLKDTNFAVVGNTLATYFLT